MTANPSLAGSVNQDAIKRFKAELRRGPIY